ncbi:PIG-L deacetylase family protein [Nonomuraea endophytica]|uniref:PIG-L deacetylase family protein n=1 Tax=Nonomuraea endophytica TaxID=714136 RepID=UPI0037C59A48
MIGLRPGRTGRIVALGAHCDDLAIGAGATLLTLGATRVDALVLSGGGTSREDEERAALKALCPEAEVHVTVLDIPDGRLPSHWERAKNALEELRAATDPDLILAPWTGDAHQDHRGLAQLVPTTFRDHLTLGYEIAKWDGDMGRPNAYHPIAPELAERKIDLLHLLYPSQRRRAWFDREAFLGLMRLRGIECNSRYAEAFHVNKLTIDLSGD